MNFQVTILKVLASYPDGFASLADVKRHGHFGYQRTGVVGSDDETGGPRAWPGNLRQRPS